MPDEIYEIIALAARYWFLFLMVLIAWRSYRWYVRDRKKYKKRLKLLPDAGYVGELVVTQGDDVVKKGACLPIGREGVLGYLRSNDVCVPVDGVANRHLWFLFDDTDGLLVTPLRGRRIVADGQELTGGRTGAFLSHGSTLVVGQAKLRLRMFSGFEYAGETEARRMPLDETGEAEDAAETPEETTETGRIRRMHEIARWQTMLEEEEAGDPAHDTPEANDNAPAGRAYVERTFYPPVYDEELESETENGSYVEGRPAINRAYAFPPAADGEPYGREYLPAEDDAYDDGQAYYPPVMDGDADDQVLPPLEEIQSGRRTRGDDRQGIHPTEQDAAESPDPNAAPKSLYVDEDEAETAKRMLWDRVFKGGKRR